MSVQMAQLCLREDYLLLSQSVIIIPFDGHIGYYWIRTKQEIWLRIINWSFFFNSNSKMVSTNQKLLTVFPSWSYWIRIYNLSKAFHVHFTISTKFHFKLPSGFWEFKKKCFSQLDWTWKRKLWKLCCIWVFLKYRIAASVPLLHLWASCLNSGRVKLIQTKNHYSKISEGSVK